MRGKAFLLGLAASGLLCLALLARSGAIGSIGLFFVFYLVAGIFQAPIRDEIRLTAIRTVVRSSGQTAASAEVRVILRNEGRKSLNIVMRDIRFENTEIIDGSAEIFARLAAKGEAEMRYAISAERGSFQWECVSVLILDPFGCFTQKMEIEAKAGVFFHPLYKRFRSFESYPWKSVSSPGIFPTRRSGQSTDFFGIREYRPGDPIRRLDWKMASKRPHAYFVREFEEESNAEIGIIIDGRAKMDIRIGKESLFETGIKLAASLADMFIRQGNRVGLSIAGEYQKTVLPGYGKRQLRKVLNALALARKGKDGAGDVIYSLPIRLYSCKAQLFFISPFDYDDLPYYRNLRSEGLQIAVISPDSIKYALSGGETGRRDDAALRLARLERKINLGRLSRLGIPLIDWDVAEPAQASLKTILRNAGRIRRP